jgi:predicted nucleotidyltransferase
MAADPKLVEALQEALRGRKDVRLALLFGSQARGKARGDSDVDVAVEGDVNTLSLISELSDATGREVDVVELERADYPLLKAVLRDGVLLHQSEPGAEAGWRTRSILRIETDRPWFERMRNAYLRRLAREAHG